ncbi:hypothetical protein C1H46_018073 [Malus baccata]|uniref:O-methyltransferase C-terminal domain-containing protein n=1 Tax=Malus baccata TaxID=106549 RepID=A0A540MC36_MALBA|nr:hypothetical protein C1H46_018073 [Malus baccata]
MRVLVHLKIFKEKPTELGPKGYAQTPLSKRLLKSGENSVAAFILLESNPVMLAPWHGLSARLQGNNNPSFEAMHGEDVWNFATANPDHSKLINDAMACDARVAVPAVIESCLEVFKGLETIVGVGGGDGTTLRLLVETWSVDSRHQLIFLMLCLLLRSVIGLRMSEVAFFFCVPKAEAALIMWVLHNWRDDDCIRILKKCREAVPNDRGKVVITEAVIEEDGKEDNKLADTRLMLDMVHQAEELYMEDSSKSFHFHGCWEICKGWVLFDDPPQHIVGHTPVFKTQSSVVDGDVDGSPTIQETRVENSSLDEGSIPRAMGQNKARRLKEKGKAKDDYAAQHEVATSLRLMVEQNAFVAEERNRRHEERAKQIQ